MVTLSTLLRHPVRIDDGDAFIPDYGKVLFEREQAAKAERRAARRQVRTKEIHLTVGIASHDLDAKVAQARNLLGSSINVRVSVDNIEVSQEGLAKAVLGRFLAAVEDAADGVMPPQHGERELVAVLWSS